MSSILYFSGPLTSSFCMGARAIGPDRGPALRARFHNEWKATSHALGSAWTLLSATSMLSWGTGHRGYLALKNSCSFKLQILQEKTVFIPFSDFSTVLSPFQLLLFKLQLVRKKQISPEENSEEQIVWVGEIWTPYAFNSLNVYLVSTLCKVGEPCFKGKWKS